MPQDIAEYNDEIDLFELFSMLWTGKVLIAGITIGFGVIGTALISLTTPPFKVKTEVRILPANGSDLAKNDPVDYKSLSGVGSLNPESALSQTVDQMRSVVKATEIDL